jgi:hypothetical protein
MIEFFPKQPSDNQSFTIAGVEFTYRESSRTWKPVDVPEDAIVSSYDTMVDLDNIVIWFPIYFLETQRLWNEIRRIRDQKIKDVEWRYNRYSRQIRMGVTPSDDIESLDEYVQALADITLQEDPNNIVWPVVNFI